MAVATTTNVSILTTLLTNVQSAGAIVGAVSSLDMLAKGLPVVGHF